MSEDEFGETQDAEVAPDIKAKFPPRAVNQVEQEINGILCDSLAVGTCLTPMIFIEENKFDNAALYEAIYGEPITLQEAFALRDMAHASVVEKFRRQLIVARECGPNATMADYLLRCEAEGLDPILKGI